MGRIKISQLIKVSEVCGQNLAEPTSEVIEVLSHPRDERLVAIRFDCKSFTVIGDDLIRAVRNAMNSGSG